MLSTKESTGLAHELASALQSRVRGQVKFDALYRQLYSTDASSYRVVPLGVVLPCDPDDVAATLAIAAQFGVPVLPRGGGTSLSGQSVGPAIIIDTSRYLDSILDLNLDAHWVRVESGVVLDRLNSQLRPHGLMFGPDPASSMAATLGGMLGNNSTGTHSILYRQTVDHTLELDVMLADGSRLMVGSDSPFPPRLQSGLAAIVDRYRAEIETGFPKTWRSVAGYNLNRLLGDSSNPAHLFVGSEGTLGVILSAKLKLVPRPPATRLAILQFESLRAALELVPAIIETGPAAIELIDRFFITLTRRVPDFARRLTFVEGDPRCLFIVEYFGADDLELASKIEALTSRLRGIGYRQSVLVRSTTAEIADVWAVRKAGFGLLMSLRGDAKPLAFVDDAAVPVEQLADYADEVERICSDAGTDAAFYAHASAGCLHINPLINLKTSVGLRQMRTIARDVAALAIRLGGTTTGEHGEGLARSVFNRDLFGPRLHQAFVDVKALFDPDNRLNPGKIVNAHDMADPDLLRINVGYQTRLAPSKTTLDFSADGGFAGLVEMCNGQGVCRTRGVGVMCPSFMATRDERHSTRGRANALRAAISGQLGPQGLESPGVFETLDLCLSCKACKTECPSTVDMAKLKAEYLSSYYGRKGIPVRNRLFGHIAELNRFGRIAWPLTNWAFENRLFRYGLERIFGIDQRRNLPLLAPQTFESWFRHNKSQRLTGTGQPVVLFHDSFMNENEPGVGQAAVRVLEAAGYEVLLVSHVCCGRPLISKGLLSEAKRHAVQNVEALVSYAEQGIPILGCEPSCVAALKDEYCDLLPHDSNARRVASQTFFLDEWLVAQANSGALSLTFAPTAAGVNVMYHGHCHQRALGDVGSAMRLLQLIPNSHIESSQAGCCGMAGSFGYEVEHYDLSLEIAEDRLFPSIRSTNMETQIAAPGTSCRHQIQHGTRRLAFHPIEILSRALASD